MDRYRIPKPAIGAALAEFYRCPFLDDDERMVVDRDLLKNLSFDYLRMNHWMPLRRQGTGVEVLIDDPHDADKIFDVRRAFPGQAISYRVGLRADIERVSVRRPGAKSRDPITDILGELVSEAQLEEQQNATIAAITENDSAIVRLANQIIAEAYRRRGIRYPYRAPMPTARKRRCASVSTGHASPHEDSGRISPGNVSRVKLWPAWILLERRKPQDGKIRFKLTTGKRLN